MRFGIELAVKVGKQPRLLGSYAKTTHAELQRRREQLIADGEKKYNQTLAMIADSLIAEGKIILR